MRSSIAGVASRSVLRQVILSFPITTLLLMPEMHSRIVPWVSRDTWYMFGYRPSNANGPLLVVSSFNVFTQPTDDNYASLKSCRQVDRV